MKLPKILQFLAVFTLMGLAGPVLDSAWADDPRATVQQLIQSIQKMHHQKPPTAEQRQANEQISRQAVAHLNVRQVSQKTLGKYWKQRSKEEQDRFVQLLGDLFRYVAFPNSSKFFGAMNLIYAPTRLDRKRATVPLTILHPEEGEVGLEFVLEQNSRRWKVVDVVLDGVSMRNNLRAQFYKVIKQHDYRELRRRLEKKLKSVRD
ncbi:MAG: ABC transporter substrate-binding protein [Nitrospina sp.]|nr:MAG: ABC transporter substrate-binding protein [Nitrospina sp.]